MRQPIAYSQSVALNPSDADVIIWLRRILLRQGRREEARVAWRQFIDRHAKVHDDWYGYAELCLFLGDVAEYQRGCRELLTRFESSTDPHICERTGRACLLLPETPQQMQRAAALIDRALAADKSRYAAWATPFSCLPRGSQNIAATISAMPSPSSKAKHPTCWALPRESSWRWR